MQEDKNKADLLAEAKRLGIKPPKVKIAPNIAKDPVKMEKELKRIEKNEVQFLENAIKAYKAKAIKKPIDIRRDMIKSRFKAVRNRSRARTYPDESIKLWINELEVIENSPKLWVKATSNGTQPYPVQGKGKKTAMALLDQMDLD